MCFQCCHFFFLICCSLKKQTKSKRYICKRRRGHWEIKLRIPRELVWYLEESRSIGKCSGTCVVVVAAAAVWCPCCHFQHWQAPEALGAGVWSVNLVPFDELTIFGSVSRLSDILSQIISTKRSKTAWNVTTNKGRKKNRYIIFVSDINCWTSCANWIQAEM